MALRPRGVPGAGLGAAKVVELAQVVDADGDIGHRVYFATNCLN